MTLLAERFRLTGQVGVLKKRQALPPSDLQREAEQLAKIARLAEEIGLDPAFAQRFLCLIIDEVLRKHQLV